MKGFSVSIIFIAIAVVLSIYLGYSMGTGGFSVKMPTFKSTGQVAVPTPTTTQTTTTTTPTTTTTTTTTQTPTTTTTTVQAAKLECTTFADCNDGKSCTIDDCVSNKCTHTLIGADCPVTTTTTQTTTTQSSTTSNTTTTTTTTQAPSMPPANHIVISEFSTRGTSASDEFIELYNPTSSEIDIGGYRIQYKSATGATWSGNKAIFTAGTKIPPHKFFLVSSAKVYTSGLTANWESTTFLGLYDEGGHIRLIDADMLGNEIDKVGWGTANDPEGGIGNAAPPQEGSGSIERKIYWQDTNNNANDFKFKDNRGPQNLASAELVPS